MMLSVPIWKTGAALCNWVTGCKFHVVNRCPRPMSVLVADDTGPPEPQACCGRAAKAVVAGRCLPRGRDLDRDRDRRRRLLPTAVASARRFESAEGAAVATVARGRCWCWCWCCRCSLLWPRVAGRLLCCSSTEARCGGGKVEDNPSDAMAELSMGLFRRSWDAVELYARAGI